MTARPTERSSISIERPGYSSVEMPASLDVNQRVVNAMTVDVEEYFQVSAFAGILGFDDWETLPSRVERSVDRLLELFAAHNAYSTFFTLGWVAERHKAMIRRIVDGGHELASHGYCHQRATDQTPEAFREDVRRTKAILEDIAGSRVTGYRAASFSFAESNRWTHQILDDEGYEYSSSVYPVRHDHYGLPDAPRFPYKPLADRKIVEFPLSTIQMMNRNFPCAGGGYFRLLPYRISRWALRRVNLRERRPGVFYFHPWEIDPGQPPTANLPAKTQFRHYVNLTRMEGKLTHALTDFEWDRMDKVLLSSIGSGS